MATVGEHGLAAGCGADRSEEVVGRRVLEQIAGGARFDRGEHFAVGVVRGEHEHACWDAGGGEGSDRAHAVHTGHPQVHQDYIGTQRPSATDRLGAISRLGDDVELPLAREHATQPIAHDRVVIDDHHPDRGAHCVSPIATAGIAALIAVPALGSDSTSSVPATPWTR